MGTLETPQDRHRYIHRTGPPEWNRQTEVQVEQGAQEAMAEQGAGGHGGAGSSGGHGGAGSSGGHGGAGSSGGHGGAGSSGGHGGTASETAAPAPNSVSSAGALLPPPPKISLGKLRGIRSPPGLNTQKQLKRPWSQSGQIRPRPAGLSNSAAAGWRNHNRLA